VKTEIYKCDCCGTERGSSNHWFGIVISNTPQRLTVGPLNQSLFVPGGGQLAYTFHLCGEQCATKTVSKFLGNGEIRWPSQLEEGAPSA